MKISERWLREWVNPANSTSELADQLTMCGLEIESISPLSESLNQIVIGQVVSLQTHPDADRLRVCQVNVGKCANLNIVCGASNVREGGKYPVALIGAILPNKLEIKQAKLRGVTSEGMLCSSTEIGLTESSEGIMELPEDAPLGMNIADYLELDDAILDLKITPNRGDCLSIRGISREIAAVNNIPIREFAVKVPTNLATKNATQIPIRILAEADCPSYYGQVIEGINSHAKTPLWMQERLRRSGIRSIHPVVDVTNYVMLELGQPLHAFDLSQISEEIQVRHARAGENLKLLSGLIVTLKEKDLVVADKKKALALAGVMGGSESGVNDQTTNIFLESAFFAPLSIAATAKQYNLNSDAAYRFERGVDTNLQELALRRAVELLLTIVGGVPGPVTFYVAKEYLKPRPPIVLRRERITRVLGQLIPDQEIVTSLERLGFTVNRNKDHLGWEVSVPSHRFDVAIEIDLIEEIARLYGYQNIVSKPLIVALQSTAGSANALQLNAIKQVLAARGYCETVSYSFIDNKLSNFMVLGNKPLELLNPISSEMSVMRTSLWPQLLEAALFNMNRQQARSRVFEIGRCFISDTGDQIIQDTYLAGIAMGDLFAEQWDLKPRAVDFYDIKKDVEEVLKLTHKEGFTFEPGQHPALHPGKAAIIKLEQQVVGYLGEIHPDLQSQLKITAKVCLFELNLKYLQDIRAVTYEAPSKFPSIRRDLAFIVDQNIHFGTIEQKIMSKAGDLLKKIQLFDIYQGESIDFGKKSVAVGLTFQLASRTLVDKEVDEIMQSIMDVLRNEFNAILRV